MFAEQVTEAAWVPVLWFCGLLDLNTGQNYEEGYWHFIAPGSSNWAATSPLPVFLSRMARKLETQSDSVCRATDPLNWKWFSPAKWTPTDCHFKVTTSAPFHGSDNLASNQSLKSGILMTLFRLLDFLYIPICKTKPSQLSLYVLNKYCFLFISLCTVFTLYTLNPFKLWVIYKLVYSAADLQF